MDMGQTFISDFLSKGIPIPAFDGISIEAPIVTWHPGFVLISGDIVYKPKLEALVAAKAAYMAA